MSKKIAHTKEELPKLQEGYVRLVHLTKAPQEYIDSIKKIGLNYEEQGMVSSTARYLGDENEVEYFMEDDRRFRGLGATAVVMDVPMEEIRVHNNITKSPGVVPSKYLVGILDLSKERKQEKFGRLERKIGGVTSIIGLFTSLFFLLPNLTGNVIFNLPPRTSNRMGLTLFFIGLIGAFFYFKGKFR